MSKGFDYSKWDKIELSDDEEDLHPNIDKESWFRMKHRSRVEREENEEKDKTRRLGEMKKNDDHIRVLEHDLKKIQDGKLVIRDVTNGDDDSDDDDLDDTEGLEAELKELKASNAAHQAKLDEYEKNKKWNVDNLCHVVEEKTIISASAGKADFTPTGYAVPKDDLKAATTDKNEPEPAVESYVEPTVAKLAPTTKKAAAAAAVAAKPVTKYGPTAEPKKSEAMDTYHEFTLKYANLVEEFMKLQSLEASKDFLLEHGQVLLQENASNYLLLASLEDEMNGYREKMKLVARQSQLISNIAELAKSMNAHPGNVVIPFFQRLENPETRAGFEEGCAAFVEKIIGRAITKKIEMDNEAAARGKETVDLSDIPKEQRLGPGGLDPLEVIESLPEEMQLAFESRDVEQLKAVLLSMPPEEAEMHMKRCIDSGLWTQ
jgi:cell division cycle protein 37